MAEKRNAKSASKDKPWGGRFAEETDQQVEAFTASIDVDKRLYRADIAGSIAHCQMLARRSIISKNDETAIVDGLREIEKEIEAGTFAFSSALEDIHMNIETALAEKIGDAAKRLHTGRSRNDQVATATRLYLRDETHTIISSLIELRGQFVALARANKDVIMPGYTHLQRAQPVLLAHHLMAYYEMFTRDTRRFADSLKRTNVMPLGSAALAGTTYPLDRVYTAQLLGFDAVSANSMDAVSDRDFIIEFLSAASLCMMHLSRLSEELVLWSSSEFGFIELSDGFCTGSSIMPQKKNPDVPEIIRGKTGRVYGALTALLTTMKALPLCYNRDMQEDKEPLFDAIDTLRSCLDISCAMVGKITVRADVMKQAAATGFLNATDMADFLVEKGMPFRDAHHCVGQAVAYALGKNKELHELTLDELQTFSDTLTAEVFDAMALETMIDRRQTAGGTASANVLAAIDAAEKTIHSEKNS